MNANTEATAIEILLGILILRHGGVVPVAQWMVTDAFRIGQICELIDLRLGNSPGAVSLIRAALRVVPPDTQPTFRAIAVVRAANHNWLHRADRYGLSLGPPAVAE